MAISKAVQRVIDELGTDKNLYYFYRTMYKYSDCGLTIGFRINGKMVYNDALPTSIGRKVVDAISVSSIVEGSGYEVPEVVLKGSRFTPTGFWKIVKNIEYESKYDMIDI